MKRLQRWLEEKCNEQNLSWREASIRAALNPGAISAIMGGQVPGLESCKALAKLFRVSPVLVLHLAGHINGITPEELTNLRYDPDFAYFASMWPLLPGYAHDIFVRQIKGMELYNDDLRAAMAAAGLDVPERPPKEE